MIEASCEAVRDMFRAKVTTNGLNGSSDLQNSAMGDEVVFESIWIATAGMDRPGMRSRVHAAITERLNLDASTHIQITNDVDLLAAAMARHPEISSSLVVIAGTGSIAIRYTWNDSDITPKRVARAGGWGHLLGDEGAGYAIGRQAIRSTLFSLEDIAISQKVASLSPLQSKILNAFRRSSRESQGDSQDIDLLSNVLMGHDDKSAKSRVAGITQMILDAAGSGDSEAVEIIAQQVSDLVDNTLSRLVQPRSPSSVEPSKYGLIVSGGVMLHSVYQTIFQLALSKRNIRFEYTEPVSNAALVGVEYLLASNPHPLHINGFS